MPTRLLLSAIVLSALTVGCATPRTAALDAAADEAVEDAPTMDVPAPVDPAPTDVPDSCGGVPRSSSCCCDGDMMGFPTCGEEGWACGPGLSLYHGVECTDPHGPCSMIGPMDVPPLDMPADVQSPEAPADEATDAPEAAVADAPDPAGADAADAAEADVPDAVGESWVCTEPLATRLGAGEPCQQDQQCASSECDQGKCLATPGGPGTYSDYAFYGIASADAFEMFVTWIDRPEGNLGIYAAFTFGFEAGQGGYMGIQRDGSLPKDRAIFSIWSIDEQSQTAECVSSGFPAGDLLNCGKLTGAQSGEGSFGQALGMYAWVPKREYRLRIESVGTDALGESWMGTITDTVTGQTTEIGTIHLDDVKGLKGYGKLKPTAAVFLEYYYGHSGYCDDDNVFARVAWRGPYANGQLAGKGYTWYPITCMYTRQCSPEKGVIVHEAGGKTAWENGPKVFWE
jgi:hypothetical protein